MAFMCFIADKMLVWDLQIIAFGGCLHFIQHSYKGFLPVFEIKIFCDFRAFPGELSCLIVWFVGVADSKGVTECCYWLLPFTDQDNSTVLGGKTDALVLQLQPSNPTSRTAQLVFYFVFSKFLCSSFVCFLLRSQIFLLAHPQSPICFLPSFLYSFSCITTLLS